MKKSVYISGPMTGMPGLNKKAFNDAEAALRAAGYEAVNPVNNGVPDSAKWEDHMRADIKLLMDCDGVALLAGWQKSRGARLEVHVAERLGMSAASVETWLTRAS